MPEDNKPHDTFFKHHFSHGEVVEGFLRNRLPEKLVATLNFDTLRRQPDGLLPSDHLGSKDADLLWSVETNQGEEIDFFLHFEAEGTPQQMAMRILIYQALIGKAYLQENQHASKIPTIISFVLYHGKRPWVGPASIAKAYKNFKQQIAFGYETPFLIDLRVEDTNKIVADGQAASAELVLAGQATNTMLQVLYQALKLNPLSCCENKLIDYYLVTNRGKEQKIFEEIRKFDPDKSNHYRNMYESLKQDFLQQGIEKGVEQGKAEAMQQALEKMIASGMSEKEAKNILGF